MRFEILKASGGHYWRIVASNGEVLAHSEVYTTKAGAEHAVAIVKANAAGAPVLDKSRAA